MNYYRSIKIISFVLFILTPIALLPQSSISFNYEFNKFKSERDSSEVLFSFSFPQNNFKFINKNNIYESNVEIQLFIKSKTDSLSRLWEIVTQANSETEKLDKMFIGSKTLKLKNDNYQIETKIIDRNSTQNYSKKTEELKLDYIPTEYQSDIIIAYRIDSLEAEISTYNPDFIREKLYLIPNSTEEIYGSYPKINIYNEIYNLKYENKYSIDLNILNAAKSKVISFKKQIKTSDILKNNFIQEINEIALDTIPSGLYFLESNLAIGNNVVDKKTKKFYLINPDQKPGIKVYFSEDEEFERSEFSTFTEEKCEDEFLYLKIIASRNEIDLYNKLTDLKAKQKFFFKFWVNRMVDPTALVNQTRENFKERIQTAKKYYRELNTRGLSDREKIIIKHGTPIDVQTYQAQDGNRAYQSFYYSDLYGGAYFYFVDVKSNGIYKLVHSTAIGEIQNYDWETRFLRDFK